MVEFDVEAFGVLLHPGHILVDVSGVDDEEEVVLPHLVDEQIVHRTAVRVEHHAIVDLSDGCSGNIVREDVLNVAFGIGTGDAHFAHVTDIEDTAMLAHGHVLVGDVRVLDGHDETAEGRHECAESHVAVIETGLFHLRFDDLQFTIYLRSRYLII